MLDEKVTERTKQLHSTYAQLISAAQERAMILMKVRKIHDELTSRLKSLCQTGLKEVSDPIGRAYILRIDDLTKGNDRLFIDNHE